MDSTTLLIIIILVLVLGGGGFYGRDRLVVSYQQPEQKLRRLTPPL